MPAAVGSLAARLAHPETQEAALDELRAATRAGTLAGHEGAEIIRVLPDLPEREDSIFPIAESVLRSLNDMRPPASWLAGIEQAYPKLRGMARWQALAMLLRAENGDSGVRSFLQLAADSKGTLDSLPLSVLDETTLHADVLFPAVLELADASAWRSDVYLAALVYLQKGKLQAQQLAPYTEQIRKHFAEAHARLGAPRDGPDIGWMFEDAYASVRREAGILLDLMGYLKSPAYLNDIALGLSTLDPHLQYCAALSLLRMDFDASPELFESIAASPEMRGTLADSLVQMGRPELFPKRYLNQQALAESELVRWLTFPTELGRPPDEIELMEVVSYDAGEVGTLDYYVFRFRTVGAHWSAKRGWLAGWTGPYRRDEGLQIYAEDTFSSFDPAESATPREHVGSLEAVLERLGLSSDEEPEAR